MAIPLYDVSVAIFLQTLGGVEGFLERALGHCRDHKIDLDDIVETRLYPDMLPFRYQILATAHHSAGALAGVKAGVFSPPPESPPLDYSALQNVIAKAREELQRLSPDAVNALQGRDVLFQAGDLKLPFTAEGFLLSFSLPNFYFHATTAYDILRSRGVPLGKRDYLGKWRPKS